MNLYQRRGSEEDFVEPHLLEYVDTGVSIATSCFLLCLSYFRILLDSFWAYATDHVLLLGVRAW